MLKFFAQMLHFTLEGGRQTCPESTHSYCLSLKRMSLDCSVGVLKVYTVNLGVNLKTILCACYLSISSQDRGLSQASYKDLVGYRPEPSEAYPSLSRYRWGVNCRSQGVWIAAHVFFWLFFLLATHGARYFTIPNNFVLDRKHHQFLP